MLCTHCIVKVKRNRGPSGCQGGCKGVEGPCEEECDIGEEDQGGPGCEGNTKEGCVLDVVAYLLEKYCVFIILWVWWGVFIVVLVWG